MAGIETPPRKEVPGKTTTPILLTLLIPALFLVINIVGLGGLVMWLFFVLSLLFTVACQWVWGHAVDKYFIIHPEDNPAYIPQGPFGRLIPEWAVDDVMRYAPQLFSPYARMDYHLRIKAHMYRLLELPLLAEIVADRWEQEERRKYSAAENRLASFDDIKAEKEQETLAGWKGKSHAQVVAEMIRNEIRQSRSIRKEAKELYLSRWFLRSLKAQAPSYASVKF